MAWSLVGVGTNVVATATPLTLTEPAGVADGDLLIACIASRTTATTAVTNTGWTAVNSQNNSNTLTTGSAIASGTMLYRIRSGTPDLTFDLPTGISVAMGQIVAYRGSAATTPLDVSTAVTAAAGTAVSVTGLTTTQDVDLIVAMAAGGQEAAWSAFANAGVTMGWNSADKSANITLSASDKTATASSSTVGAVRSTTTHLNGTAGKYYAELVLNTVVGGGPCVGIQATSATITVKTVDTVHVFPNNGNISHQGLIVGSVGGALASGDIFCLAWDSSAKMFWARKNSGLWNNDASANPATGTNGIDVSSLPSSAFALWMSNNVTSGVVATARTEAAEFTLGMPSGFSAWQTGSLAALTASGTTNTATTPSTTAWIERADNVTTTGADTSLGIFDAVRTGTGATGNLTVTASVSAGHVVIAGAFKIAVATTADAWSAADKSANITLSASDKTATFSSTSGAGVRSTQKYLNGAAGKYYAEFRIDQLGSGARVGLTTTSGAVDNTQGFFITSGGLIQIDGGSSSVFADIFTTGDVVCMAWDSSAKLIWFRVNGGVWNDGGSDNPATGVGGISAPGTAEDYALHYTFSTQTIGAAVTVRTKLAEYTRTVPSGFKSWMGETPGVNVSVTPTGVSAASALGTAAAVGKRNISISATGQTAAAVVGTATVTVGGAGPWTPADLTTGQISWLDAADSSKLTFSGANLTAWGDKSPAVRNATKTGSLGPTLTSVNSLGSLQFANQPLTTAATTFGDFTVFAVFKPDGSPSSISTRNYERLLDHDVFNGWWIGRYAFSTNWQFGIKQSVDPYGIGISLADGQTHLITAQRASTTQTWSGNGGAVSSSGACDGTVTTSNPVWITTESALVSSLYGVVSEILIYSTALSADDQSKMEGYLAWKWGIQANLPAGHPYKSAPPTTGGGPVNVTATPAGVSAATALGAATATGVTNVGTSATGISAAAVAGTAIATGKANVAATGISAGTALGTATVSGNSNVTCTGVSAAALVGTATASGATSISTSATGQAAGTAVGAATIATTQTVNITPAGVVAGAAAGTVSVAVGSGVTATPVGVTATAVVGTATATGKQNVSIAAAGVSAAAVAGSATVAVGTGVTIAAVGVAAATALGTATAIGKQFVTVAATGASAPSVLGGVTVTAGGSISVGASGVEAAVLVGTPTVTAKQSVGVAASGVTAAAIAGTPSASGKINISTMPAGAIVTTALGSVTVTAKRNVTTMPVGVAAAALVGTASVTAAVGGVGVWTGTAWAQKPAKAWSGAAWVSKPVKTWNGSAWV